MRTIYLMILSVLSFFILPAFAQKNQAKNYRITLGKVPETAVYTDGHDGKYSVWGASMVKGEDGLYHIFYSRWPKDIGWSWVTDSEIAHAVSVSPYGPWKFKEVVFHRRGKQYWDGWCTHNPTVHKFGNKYYLYYMGNTGDGQIKGRPGKEVLNWTHRNNQRIGVAVADSPNGPWKRYDHPLIDISSDDKAPDCLMVSNPSICETPDGKYLLLYKAVGKKYPLPGGGPVVHMVAFSDSPTGPFKKHSKPVFCFEGERFPVEDPYIWYQDGKYRAIVKRMKNKDRREFSLVQFESVDGLDWKLAEYENVSGLTITWENGKSQKLTHLERPQVYMENSKPLLLLCAADTTDVYKVRHSFNVQIPLRMVAQKTAKQYLIKKQAVASENYQSITHNGAWCWFSDPRAVYYEGKYKRTYAGWIDNYGDVHVGYFDHDTKEIASVVVADNLEIDDHNVPSLYFDDKGYLQVYYNTHMIGSQPLFLLKSNEPESITSFGEVKKLYLNDKKEGSNHCYTNVVSLSAEANRQYLFWRGMDNKPTFSYSDDGGDTWSAGQIYFKTRPKARPYTKVYSKGDDKIHFTFTDGHPRNEPLNSIYYVCYKNGAFYKADGTKTKEIKDLPLTLNDVDIVYQGNKETGKAWNWDIAEDKDGNPIIAFARFPVNTDHIYCLARVEKGGWKKYDLVHSGKWFPQTVTGRKEYEDNYSGGMSIDKENTDILYLSINRDSVFEIEKWTMNKTPGSWKVEAITSGSNKDNVRPFAVKGAQEGNPHQVMWMQNTRYINFGYHEKIRENFWSFEERYQTAIKLDRILPETEEYTKREGILNLMRRVADWQLENPFTGGEWKQDEEILNWVYATFWRGLCALHDVTGEERYVNELLNLGAHHKYGTGDNFFHADRVAIINVWAYLYGLYKQPEMLERSKWVLNAHLYASNYKKGTDVRFADNPRRGEWWSWCDALYMAPTAFASVWEVTGEDAYLDYMITQWWKTSDYLYSKTDSLYYRDDRFFSQRTENGKKVFWGRGNGWVIGGLTQILDILPSDSPYRPRFIAQYKEMIGKLLSLQTEDGLWTSNLLDKDYLSLGETSATVFNAYALAWGINNGLIDTCFSPQLEKAWSALCGRVMQSGCLGYVQRVAASPTPFGQDDWQMYASGAFLLLGREMTKFYDGKNG